MNDIVKHNSARFAADFMFALTPGVWASGNQQASAARQNLPHVFTAHDAVIAISCDVFSRGERDQLSRRLDALRDFMPLLDLPRQPVEFAIPKNEGEKTASKCS